MRRYIISVIVILVLPIFVSDLSSDAREMPPLLADGQFVYAPDETSWDIEGALRRLDSPLAPYAGYVELYALMSSVDPRVLLAGLELEGGLVTAPGPLDEAQVITALDSLSRRLYQAFYTAREGIAGAPAAPSNAATRALEGTLGPPARDFDKVASEMFPDFDPGDESNRIDPAAFVPAGLLQFPYPLGETWSFNGTHGWSGYDTPPSSIDFSDGWPACGQTYSAVVVAAGDGVLRKPRTYADCWLEIDHSGGWTTSYYHLTDVQRTSGPIEADTPLGHIGCETCAGGFATSAHVHFSLKYNGAYVSLEGAVLSGWTIHTGSSPYSNDTWLTRDGIVLYPYSSIYNDGGAGDVTPPPPTSTPDINPPELLTPRPGTVLYGYEVAVAWDPPPNEPAPSHYRLRVRTTDDMDGSTGQTALNMEVGWDSGIVELEPHFAGQLLYWSVQACRDGDCSTWAQPWHFQISTPSVLPAVGYLPLQLKDTRPPVYVPPTRTATSPSSTPTATSTPTGTFVPTSTSTVTASATPTLTPGSTPTSGEAYQEAEWGELISPMVTAHDETASEKYYVHTPPGGDAGGEVRFGVTLDEGGMCEVWARGMGLGEDADGFQVTVDIHTEDWTAAHGEWAWDNLVSLYLEPGAHTIVFQAVEPGARLDAIELRQPAAQHSEASRIFRDP